MPLPLSCPNCQRALSLDESLAGKMVMCPNCKVTFQAPGANQYSSSPPPPAYNPAPPQAPTPDPHGGYPPNNYPPPNYPPGYYPPPPQYGYAPPPYGYYPGYDPRMQPHRGSTVLTLGILSIFLCGPVLGTIAWVMGQNDLREMREGRMDPSGESNTQTGRTIGMVMTILWGSFTLLYIILAIAAAGSVARF